MNNNKWFDNAVMINRDPCWYIAIDDCSEIACRSSLENYFSLYEGKVTDVCLGIFEQTSLIPSKSFMWRGEKYLQKTENGYPVDYTGAAKLDADGLDNLGRLYNCFVKYNIDAVQIFIEQMNRLGIRPWLALRMNDAHHTTDNIRTSYLRSDMFYEEKAAVHNVGEKYGYAANCQNFKYPRYRTALLGFIGEVLDNYDFFGLELDFMREIYCFDFLLDKDCHRIMTEYIREIKKLVQKAEQRVGHRIRISLRICRSPVDAKEFGFDVKTLCDEGLIDVVIPTARYYPMDSGIPIREWRELLGNDVAVMGGIEANIDGGPTLPKHSKAYAAAFYAQGANGIYYNNHEYYTDRNRASWQINRDTCYEGLREFVVLYQDCYITRDRRYKPLPLTVDGHAELKLEIGRVNPQDKVTLVISPDCESEPDIVIGSRKFSDFSKADPIIIKTSMETVVYTPVLAYDISGIKTDGTVTITFKAKGTINYVSIIIEAT